MNVAALLPITAGIAAGVIGITRRLSLLLIELDGATILPQLLSATTLGGRLVSFLAVYGLVLGTAYLLGRQSDPPGSEPVSGASSDELSRGHTHKQHGGPAFGTGRVLTAGSVATLAHLLAASAILLVVELSHPWILTGVTLLGSSVAVGIQIAIVVVAGLALGGRR